MCCSGEKKLLSEEGARIVRRILKTLTKLLLDYMEGEERRKREKGDNRKKENYVSKIREKGEKSSGRANAAKGATKEKKDKKTLFISGGIGYNKLYHG